MLINLLINIKQQQTLETNARYKPNTCLCQLRTNTTASGRGHRLQGEQTGRRKWLGWARASNHDSNKTWSRLWFVPALKSSVQFETRTTGRVVADADEPSQQHANLCVRPSRAPLYLLMALVGKGTRRFFFMANRTQSLAHWMTSICTLQTAGRAHQVNFWAGRSRLTGGSSGLSVRLIVVKLPTDHHANANPNRRKHTRSHTHKTIDLGHEDWNFHQANYSLDLANILYHSIR